MCPHNENLVVRDFLKGRSDVAQIYLIRSYHKVISKYSNATRKDLYSPTTPSSHLPPFSLCVSPCGHRIHPPVTSKDPDMRSVATTTTAAGTSSAVGTEVVSSSAAVSQAHKKKTLESIVKNASEMMKRLPAARGSRAPADGDLSALEEEVGSERKEQKCFWFRTTDPSFSYFVFRFRSLICGAFKARTNNDPADTFLLFV